MDGTLYEVLEHVQRHHAILYWAAPAVAADGRRAGGVRQRRRRLLTAYLEQEAPTPAAEALPQRALDASLCKVT